MAVQIALDPVPALADLVAEIRLAAAEASTPSLRRRLDELAARALAIRQVVMDGADYKAAAAEALARGSVHFNSRAKNAGGLRSCSACGHRKAASAFNWKDRPSGQLRAECKDCYNARQKARYVRATRVASVIELLDGDECLGHSCPVCSKPFEVGQRVRSATPIHDHCQPSSHQPQETE